MVDQTLDGLLQMARERERLRATRQKARAIREAAGLSRRDVARVIGVEQSTLYRWENGERTPRGESLQRYLAVLERLQQEQTP